MNVQELKDFLETVGPDPEAEVLVSIGGRLVTPMIAYSGGDLLLEVPGPKRKTAPKRKTTAKKTRR